VVFCRYTNHEYETRTDRVYRLVNSERRMYKATEINYVSPKIFGSYFGLRGRVERACITHHQMHEYNVCFGSSKDVW
jgi:hypothetical protein